MRKTNLILAIILLACISCGSDDDSKSETRIFEQEEEQGDEGIYRAVLRPINQTVSHNSTGTVEAVIVGEDLIFESNLIGTPAGIKHRQYIMYSSSCPVASDDTNNDSFIDMNEAMQTSGQVLIPLDSNLSEQLKGIDYGPIANSQGAYVYKRRTIMSEILSDLRAPDLIAGDHLVKLPLGENLNLSRRVILVHGVSSNTDLPESVSTVTGLTSEESLPIACGEIVRIPNEEI